MHELDIAPLLILAAANRHVLSIVFSRYGKAITRFTQTIHIFTILGNLSRAKGRDIVHLHASHRLIDKCLCEALKFRSLLFVDNNLGCGHFMLQSAGSLTASQHDCCCCSQQ